MKKQQSDKYPDDIFGMAISQYYNYKDETDIIVLSPDFENDVIPVHYLFRNYNEMPPLEITALDNCQGRVLDVGSGAGSHALFLQEERGLKVTAIDISPGATEISKLRGVKDARCLNFFDLKNEKFDTLLFLMNGTGIIGKLDNLDYFFEHCKTLLSKKGKIIIDSSDLRYLFDEDEDGGIWIKNEQYYGELEYRLGYKGSVSAPFHWLYLDYNLLNLAATKSGFTCKLLKEGEHFDYLAKLQYPFQEP